MDTQTLTTSTTQDFWSQTFHGHAIAAYRHSQGWLVYIDCVIQPSRRFASLDSAVRWMQCKIEEREIDRQIAALGRRRSSMGAGATRSTEGSDLLH